MVTVAGLLGNAGLQPFQGRWPDLSFIPERPTTSGVHVIVRDPVAAVINDATGAFTAEVEASGSTLPTVRYTVRARWDVGREVDVYTGLWIPEFDCSISDAILASGDVLRSMPFGWGPPPPSITSGLYFDLESGEIWGTPPEGV